MSLPLPLGATLAMLLAATACAAPTPASSPSARPEQSTLSASVVTERQAIELAQQHTDLTTLVSVNVGGFASLHGDVGDGYPIKPDDTVWAIQFSGEITICNPFGKCFSPRPATTTVYLDYVTGNFRTSETLSVHS